MKNAELTSSSSSTTSEELKTSLEEHRTLLSVEGLRCGYGKTEIVHDGTFNVNEGEFVCIIGANGCGKTTLLKNILMIEKPFSGFAKLAEMSLDKMTDAERAKYIAYLPQEHTPPFPFAVGDVVLMGRTPHLQSAAKVKDADKRITWDALCLLGIEHLSDRPYTELSGGQRQLVLIARCLAQQPKLIVMDEPTASLDFGNQQTVLSRMHELTRDGMGVLMVTHDPHHAFLCADRVVVMQDGNIICTGNPADVMTYELLESIYGSPVDVVDVKLRDGSHAKACLPMWKNTLQ